MISGGEGRAGNAQSCYLSSCLENGFLVTRPKELKENRSGIEKEDGTQ